MARQLSEADVFFGSTFWGEMEVAKAPLVNVPLERCGGTSGVMSFG